MIESTTVIITKKTFNDDTDFVFEHFLIACPYTIEQLREKSRLQDIMQWRQIGMAWYAMEHDKITEAGSFFNKDHSTVWHSLNCVAERKFNPRLSEKVDKVLDVMRSDVVVMNDFSNKEVSSLVYMEQLIRNRYPSI